MSLKTTVFVSLGDSLAALHCKCSLLHCVSRSFERTVSFHLHKVGVNSERDEAKTLSEDFILDDRGVEQHKDLFDSHGRDVSHKDAADGVGYRSIYADEVILDVLG